LHKIIVIYKQTQLIQRMGFQTAKRVLNFALNSRYKWTFYYPNQFSNPRVSVYSSYSIYDSDFFQKQSPFKKSSKNRQQSPLINMDKDEKLEFVKNQWQKLVQIKKSSVPQELTSQFLEELLRAESLSHLNRIFK
jgi:hypothetical protein